MGIRRVVKSRMFVHHFATQIFSQPDSNTTTLKLRKRYMSSVYQYAKVKICCVSKDKKAMELLKFKPNLKIADTTINCIR